MTAPDILEITREYERDGWKVVDPGDLPGMIGFKPDLTLRRDDDTLVVQFRRAGRRASQPTSLIRRNVERLKNHKFEVRVLRAPSAATRLYQITPENIPYRLEAATRLRDLGHYSESLVISTIVIELCLREILKRCGVRYDARNLGELIRTAFEEEAINKSELKQLTDLRAVRNRVLHGFNADVTEFDAKVALAFASYMIKKAGQDSLQ